MLALLGFFLFNIPLQAQQEEVYKEHRYTPNATNFEQFINQAYGNRAQELVFDREIRALILKDYFTRRMTVVERNSEIPMPDWFVELSSLDQMGYVSAPAVSGDDLENFNPFYYNIDYLNTEEWQYIRISGTNFYLVIQPFDVDEINKLR